MTNAADFARTLERELAGKATTITTMRATINEARAESARLRAALLLVNELAFNALDHAMPRNSATVNAIVQAARAALAGGAT